MLNITTLITLNLISSSGIFILIWLTQVLIYPSFLLVNPSDFRSYHRLHTNRISWIVAPLMLVDAIASVLILIEQDSPMAILNALLSAVPLASTFFYYGPQHDRITRSYSIEKIKALINYNWLRVGLWSAKLFVAYKMLGIELYE